MHNAMILQQATTVNMVSCVNSYAMNPGGPIGGPLPDVPPFSTDKTAVFFFEDYVEGYEVILMISQYDSVSREINSTPQTLY